MNPQNSFTNPYPLQVALTDAQWYGFLAEDKLNNPQTFYDIHPALRAIIREWVRLKVKPTKTISSQRYLNGIKRAFGTQTKLYVWTGVILGALLEAGYRAELRGNDLCLNCSIRKPSNPYTAWEKYRAIAPIYSEWVLDTPKGYWLPELYEGMDNIAAKYDQRTSAIRA
ncbi:hypothetical protein [Nostoc punctiforme]|uniref:hypothetical protein n=1 Tax=Nostoc punctiforme TaxID=272131 RepID=UPI000045C238|nr:hypothetical protein [Nostoc punctiforme]